METMKAFNNFKASNPQTTMFICFALLMTAGVLTLVSCGAIDPQQ